MPFNTMQPQVRLSDLVNRGARVNFPAAIQTAANYEHSRPQLIAAVEHLVRERFDIKGEDFVQFELTLKSFREMRPIGNTPNLDPIPVQLDESDLIAEIQKRRAINQLIHGGAIVAACDYNGLDLPPVMERTYYDLMAAGAYQQQQCRNTAINYDILPPAGVVRVSHETVPPTIIADAINVPLLLHEAVKGLLELTAMWGLPGAMDDENTPELVANYNRALRAEVLKRADGTKFEIMDLTNGIDPWCNQFGDLPYSKVLTAFAQHCKGTARNLTPDLRLLMRITGSPISI